jgi:hypothetical protein
MRLWKTNDGKIRRNTACGARKYHHKTFSIRFTWFLGFVHPPEFYILENTIFQKLVLFPSSGEGKDMPILLGPS